MIHPYATEAFLRSLSGAADMPVAVPEWRTWVLRRTIDGGPAFDAMGGYPVAAIDSSADIVGGLERLRRLELISIVLVSDPILRPSLAALKMGFDFARPFKKHYLHDNRLGPPQYSKHHRYTLRNARATVQRINLTEFLPSWIALYGELVDRRRIEGVAAFSDAAFGRLAALPRLTCFGAFADDKLVACHLWLDDGRQAHSHLSASSAEGYTLGAPYLLCDTAVRHFADVETIDFGGAAGLRDNPNDGLARFKRGFSNRDETAYLCGTVFDPDRYGALCAAAGATGSTYFPAYRRARKEDEK